MTGLKQADVVKQLMFLSADSRYGCPATARGIPPKPSWSSKADGAGQGSENILAKSAWKMQFSFPMVPQSVGKLARKLTDKSHPASKTTVHHYLTKCLHLKSLSLRRQPKLTEVQKRKRLAFVKARKNWTVPQW